MRARAHPDRNRINQPARGNYVLQFNDPVEFRSLMWARPSRYTASLGRVCSIDLLVDKSVVVELKAAWRILINFNVEVLRRGIYRIING